MRCSTIAFRASQHAGIHLRTNSVNVDALCKTSKPKTFSDLISRTAFYPQLFNRTCGRLKAQKERVFRGENEVSADPSNGIRTSSLTKCHRRRRLSHRPFH